MSIQWAHAPVGKEFKPTYRGKQIGQVAAKFKDTYIHSNSYKHSVPKRWLTEEYVEIVDSKEE